MIIDDWDKAPNGNLICFPMTGCKTAPMLNGMVALVRIEYLRKPNFTDVAALQLAITINEVTRFIGELQILEKRLKENLAADKPSGKPS